MHVIYLAGCNPMHGLWTIAIDGKAVQTLADFVGPNLRQLDNELEKRDLCRQRGLPHYG